MLLVGLGNPGPKYAQTRHNIGFMVIDELVKRYNSQKISAPCNGELFKFSNHYLLKPLTFMNLSGEAIIAVKNFYKIDEVVVIHDDLDLPFGAIRFKRGGGHGGHNGLKSTDEKITQDYVRIRMGIGKPEHKGEVATYVLSDFSQKEKEHLSEWILYTCSAINALLSDTLENVSAKYTVKDFEIK
jgi:PTH1 family peptidyl-tRNA hydrolase